ncbi:unnamed protein product [Diplocarpon coronariae]
MALAFPETVAAGPQEYKKVELTYCMAPRGTLQTLPCSCARQTWKVADRWERPFDSHNAAHESPETNDPAPGSRIGLAANHHQRSMQTRATRYSKRLSGGDDNSEADWPCLVLGYSRRPCQTDMRVSDAELSGHVRASLAEMALGSVSSGTPSLTQEDWAGVDLVSECSAASGGEGLSGKGIASWAWAMASWASVSRCGICTDRSGASEWVGEGLATTPAYPEKAKAGAAADPPRPVGLERGRNALGDAHRGNVGAILPAYKPALWLVPLGWPRGEGGKLCCADAPAYREREEYGDLSGQD